MMTPTTDDRPTPAERYASAMESSNLRMKERSGDLDVIIAAGCLDDSFASALLRVQVEYDLIRGEHRMATLRLRQREAEAQNQKGDELDEHGNVISTAAERAEAITLEAEAAAATAHALIMLQLSTLRVCKEMMGAFALRMAERLKFPKPQLHVMRLAEAVLDVHVQPVCPHCLGRRFTGGFGRNERKVPCRPCKGMGTRRDQLGADDADRLFAGRLLMELSALMDRGEEQLQRKRFNTAMTKALITEAEATAIRR